MNFFIMTIWLYEDFAKSKLCVFSAAHCGRTLRITFWISRSPFTHHLLLRIINWGSSMRLSITLQNQFNFFDQVLRINRSPSPQENENRRTHFLIFVVQEWLVKRFFFSSGKVIFYFSDQKQWNNILIA